MANAKNITKVIVGEDLYYLKDKQVRDSIGAANGIATLDSEGKISSSQIPAGIGDVTGVKGDSESSYRTGNVNITKGNIGLGNVGNFKAVSTAASQGLTDTEKSNARTNIGAGTGNGTVTGIKMNGASKGTSGVVDLGTVITAHQDISGKADKATTLAGYGITDAKIASGVITLGSNTITPLTSHQDISGKADKSATVSNVAWGSNKLTKTINGTTSDVVTASTIKTALSLAKGDVGLGNVTNDAQVKRSEMGVASGVATLGTDGKVPSSQLPSYVDDVLEYANKASFPSTGETGKIYVDKATDTTWRWSGSAYTQIKGDLVIGTATGNAADGKVVNDHIGNTSNPHSVTKTQVGLGNVENKSSATIRSEITSSNVTAALGYTPYNSTNPNGYTSNTGTVTGVKVGSSGSTINPSSGVVTIPAYEEGAQKHIAPTETEVKSALGTGSGTSKYLREDGTWQTPPDHTYTVNNGTFSLKQKAGSTTTTVADFTANQSGTDDITFIQGSNITLTPDTTNRTITIASTGIPSQTGNNGKFLTTNGTSASWASISTKTNEENGFGIGTCSTSSGTALVASLTNYNLVKNGFVAVTFTYDVPANATLNINSKGAKAIYYKGAAITGNIIKAGETVLFCYDGTNYVYVENGKTKTIEAVSISLVQVGGSSSDLIGATVVVKDMNSGDTILSTTWNGSTISVEIQFGVLYKVEGGAVSGYIADYSTHTASLANGRNVELQYKGNGAYIEATDGSVYTSTNWSSSGKTANAVLLVAGSRRLRIGLPQVLINHVSDDSHTYTELPKYTTQSDALADYNGASNTEKMLAVDSTSAFAAGWCNYYTFPNGQHGYLPSLGEFNLMYQNKTAINECITACNGMDFHTDDLYWTSTFNTDNSLWIMSWSNGNIMSNQYIWYKFYFRAVCAYD